MLSLMVCLQSLSKMENKLLVNEQNASRTSLQEKLMAVGAAAGVCVALRKYRTVGAVVTEECWSDTSSS